jgi:hypothetical protein
MADGPVGDGVEDEDVAGQAPDHECSRDGAVVAGFERADRIDTPDGSPVCHLDVNAT